MIEFDSTLFICLSAAAKELNKRPLLRKVLLIIFCVFDFIAIVILVTNHLLNFPNKEAIFNIALIFTFVLSVGFIVSALSYFPNIYNKMSVSDKLAVLADKRTKIEDKIKEGNNGNVQEIIKLNLNQLDEYYTINKSQNKSSYGFSVFMIIVGFLLVITTVIIFFMYSEKYTIAVITGLAGLISGFIGATSLSLFKESTEHLDDFIKRLTYLQKVMLAIDLAEKLPDEKRDAQISNIITGLMYSEKDT